MRPEQEHQQRVGVFPHRSADLSLVEAGLLDAVDRTAAGLGFEQVDGDVERLVPGAGEVRVLPPDLIGMTPGDARFPGGFADISGLAERFQKQPFFADSEVGLGHGAHQ